MKNLQIARWSGVILLTRVVSLFGVFYCVSSGIAAQTTAASQQIRDGPGALGTRSGLVTVAKGTEIELALQEDVSSADAQNGQVVRMAVDKDVVIDGRVAIPKGTAVTGEVVHVRRAVPGMTDGDVEIRPRGLTLADGTILRLREYPPVEDACANVGPCWVLDVLFAPIVVAGHVVEADRHRRNPDRGVDRVLTAKDFFIAYTPRRWRIHAAGLAPKPVDLAPTRP